MTVAFLLVTCCLEPSRAQILQQVVDNLKEQAPELVDCITVFDNASTQPDVVSLLNDTFKNVYRADRNVGYWSAIDWWLNHIDNAAPELTYIIESDMIHYAFDKLWTCARYLNDNPEVGSVRLHEYSVAERHLYDKDRPRHDSKRTIWQSHTNKVTGNPVKLVASAPPYENIYKANFLTQLPALNRYAAMKETFNHLSKAQSFSELDFQRIYHAAYPLTAIIDGGIFHCDPGSYGAKTVTGSWTDPAELARIGYQSTRYASILPRDQYTVQRVE